MGPPRNAGPQAGGRVRAGNCAIGDGDDSSGKNSSSDGAEGRRAKHTEEGQTWDLNSEGL